MEKLELEGILHSLGKRFTLDILEMIHNTGPCTASEIAKTLNIQVATAVKHLSGLHESGILVRDVRKGKTRSAYEYSLKNDRIIIEIDVSELNTRDEQMKGQDHLFRILIQVTRKISAFTGKKESILISSWKINLEGHDKTLEALEIALNDSPAEAFDFIARVSKDTDLATEISSLIFDILKLYESKYGKSSMRSLALTSRDASLRQVTDKDIIDQVNGYLPKRYFEQEVRK